MKRISFEALLSEFDESVRPVIPARAQKLGATHVVVFENLDFCSSQLGKKTAVMVGPSCTYTSPEMCEGKWLNDLPSQRQYPTAYAEVPA